MHSTSAHRTERASATDGQRTSSECERSQTVNDPFGCTVCPDPFRPGNTESHLTRAELAERLRHHLGDTIQRLTSGVLDIQHPDRPAGMLPRGLGHFHLACELFVQISGWTLFRLPQGDLRLEAGQALLLPPRLLHDERVGAGSDGRRFENLVLYAEDGALRCHLAHEASSGVPGMLHLDMCRHAQATRIQEWLSSAVLAADERTRGSPDSPVTPLDTWGRMQSRALVVAALSGVLRAIDDRPSDALPEPVLVSRVRVMIQNQLGDSTLTVRQLAEQAGCTADYLSNLFSIATREHLSSYINRLRVERAAHLLRESSLSGKEIAWACGFSSQSYFIRAFRAHFGQTPKTWRVANS